MTTIIGVQLEHGCVVVSDSRIAASGKVYTHPDMVKAVQRGHYLIAGAGTTQPCDIIQHIWKPPTPTPTSYKDLYHFMIAEVATSMRLALAMNGYTPDKESDEPDFIFLIALGGVIFELDDSLSVLMRDDGIYGIGSGSPYAIGAIQAGATWKQSMQIAARNNVFTAAPFITHKQVK
jgi:ATP-dependent protease HslVU (ClpYQ) peptidase subunit